MRIKEMSKYTQQDIEIAREAGLFIGGGLVGLIFYGILNWPWW